MKEVDVMSQFNKGTGARIIHLVLLLIVGSLLGGCSYIRSSKRMDMGPFAENTIDLIADIRHGMDANSSIYLTEYTSLDAVSEYRTNWKAYRPVLRGIAAYSLAIVTISKAQMNDEMRCQKLAEVLDEFLRPRILDGHANLLMSEEELDEMLGHIREQTKYLDGLNAAQPLVDAVENFSHAFLDMLNEQLDEGRAKIDHQIKADHATSRRFYKMLVETQNFGFENLVFLRDYMQGEDPEALQKLLDRDPQLRILIPDPEKATPEDILKVQERVLYRLEKTRELTAQVQPDLDLYRHKMLELDTLYKAASNNLIKTRVTVIIWSRSHRGLASGIVDPAQIDVMGIAKRALKAAMPI